MIQHFDYEFYLSKNELKLGSAKPVVLEEFHQQELRKRLLQSKERIKVRQLLIGYSLKFSWLFVIGCSKSFDFITLRHLQAYFMVCLCRLPQH